MTSLIEVNFDNSLNLLAKFVAAELGEAELFSGTFLRDGFGRISFYSPMKLAKHKMKRLNGLARDLLGGHGAIAGPIFDAESPGAQALSGSSKNQVYLDINGHHSAVCVVDRRFYGRDWQATPKSLPKDFPPLFVFNSLKGGVGRTTALFFLSIYLSRLGKNILLVDLDLEAPGLASLLFTPAERPRFGVIDYLTELGLSGVDDADLRDFVGLSNLTDRATGQGRVDLVPAAGQQTVEQPSGMMAKLARALLEVPKEEGGTIALAQQIRTMVERFNALTHYDIILVDARAGLAEITAAPLIELGGWNLFFGTDHPHTFEGYRYLLSHLSTLPVATEDDWRERVAFVHAKAPVSEERRVRFNDKLYDVLAENFYERDEGLSVFNYNLDNNRAPHAAWPIYMSGDYVDADPMRDRSILDENVYRGIFGDFIDRVMEIIENDGHTMQRTFDI